MPEISVIVPVYNIEEHKIKRCIDSILNQTFDNIEIIAVDDGSSNDALNVLNEYNNRITIIHQENSGVSVARNNGTQKASGTWIMYVDADDWLTPDAIQKLYNSADKETDIISCCCIVQAADFTKKISFFRNSFECTSEKDKKELYKQLMNGRYGQDERNYYTAIGVPWGKLYRKEFLLNNELRFDPKLRRMQDNLFNMYAFYKARKVKYIDECLYNYDYSHMTSFQKTYNPDTRINTLNIASARDSAVKELELFKDKELKEFYLNEKLRFLAQILVKDPMNRAKKISFIRRIKEIREICSMDEFKILYTEKDKSFAFNYGIKTKVFYLLTKNKLYFALALLTK